MDGRSGVASPDMALAALRHPDRGRGPATVLRDVLHAPDDEPWRVLTDRALRDPATAAAMLDAIPALAAAMGDGWMDDALSFVDVSIGATRLHAALRRLGAPAARAATTPAIPVLVPPWEQHLLAASLAAHRLCAAGRRAVVLTDLQPAQAARMPLIQAAPALMVSCTRDPSPRRLEDYLHRLRTALRGAVPIVVGGPGFGTDPADRAVPTDASCVATDPAAALRSFGIAVGGGAHATNGD